MLLTDPCKRMFEETGPATGPTGPDGRPRRRKARTMARFSDKTALVTGGGSGIGAAISRALAAEGASVVVTDIKLDAAQGVVDQIVAAGGTAVAFEQNTAKPEQCEAAVEFAKTTYGALHLAVNNAGIGAPPPTSATTTSPPGTASARSTSTASSTVCAISFRPWSRPAAEPSST
nr:hypothetical protein GCM10025699_77630 [Microbacterium flavescens]